MKPMSPDARELLAQLRDAEDATAEDEARVKRSLDAALAAGLPPLWERQPAADGVARGDGVGAPPGEATIPAGAVAKAGGIVAKAGVAWGASLGVLALCAAALFTIGDGEGEGAPRPSLAASDHAPSEHSQQEQGAAPSLEATRAEVAAAPIAVADAGVPRSKASARRANAPSQRRASSSLEAELGLLQRAQAALRRGDGASALRELDAFRGGGQLLAERRVARVLALCSLGRVAEARALAAELLRAEPRSVQRTALERSCANPSRIGER